MSCTPRDVDLDPEIAIEVLEPEYLARPQIGQRLSRRRGRRGEVRDREPRARLQVSLRRQHHATILAVCKSPDVAKARALAKTMSKSLKSVLVSTCANNGVLLDRAQLAVDRL